MQIPGFDFNALHTAIVIALDQPSAPSATEGVSLRVIQERRKYSKGGVGVIPISAFELNIFTALQINQYIRFFCLRDI